jgi:hypothetical protein
VWVCKNIEAERGVRRFFFLKLGLQLGSIFTGEVFAPTNDMRCAGLIKVDNCIEHDGLLYFLYRITVFMYGK